MITQKEEGYELIEYELAQGRSAFKVFGNLILCVALLIALIWPWIREVLPVPARRIDVFGSGDCAFMHRDFVSRFPARGASAPGTQCFAQDDPYYLKP